MNQITKMKTCLSLNIFLLSIVYFFVINYASPNLKYFQFGSNEDLTNLEIAIINVNDIFYNK